MKKNILLFVTLQSSFLFSQVGINTTNPQGVFHIDGKSTAETTNTLTGIPTAKQLLPILAPQESGEHRMPALFWIFRLPIKDL